MDNLYLVVPMARPQHGFTFEVKRAGAMHAVVLAATREIALLLARVLNERDNAIKAAWDETGKRLRDACGEAS